MPLYPVHVSANRRDPLPPVAELTTIEADSPEQALELLRREAFVVPPGVTSVWLKGVVGVWPGVGARYVLSTEVPVQRLDELN